MERGPHHYVYAHLAMRDCCMSDPIGFFRLMNSPRSRKLLEELWEQVKLACDTDGPASMDVREVKVETFQAGPFPGVLVVMPPPMKVPEAYFIAIILFADLTGKPAKPPEVMYYTLEKSGMPDEAEYTMLGRWRKGGIHENHGLGPPPSKDAFLSMIQELVLSHGADASE